LSGLLNVKKGGPIGFVFVVWIRVAIPLKGIVELHCPRDAAHLLNGASDLMLLRNRVEQHLLECRP